MGGRELRTDESAAPPGATRPTPRHPVARHSLRPRLRPTARPSVRSVRRSRWPRGRPVAHLSVRPVHETRCEGDRARRAAVANSEQTSAQLARRHPTHAAPPGRASLSSAPPSPRVARLGRLRFSSHARPAVRSPATDGRKVLVAAHETNAASHVSTAQMKTRPTTRGRPPAPARWKR